MNSTVEGLRQLASQVEREQQVWWTPLSRPKKRFRSVRYRVWIQFHIPTSTGPACPQAFLFAPQTLHRG